MYCNVLEYFLRSFTFFALTKVPDSEPKGVNFCVSDIKTEKFYTIVVALKWRRHKLLINSFQYFDKIRSNSHNPFESVFLKRYYIAKACPERARYCS